MEVDSTILVDLILTKATGKWPLCLILQQIRLLLYELSASVTHVWHQANLVVDGIAALTLNSDKEYNSYHHLPNNIRALILSDRSVFSILD